MSYSPYPDILTPTPEELIDSIREHSMIVGAIKSDIARQRKRIQEHEAAIERDRKALARAMQDDGKSKVETGAGKASLTRLKSLTIDDMSALEKEYPEYLKTVSKTKFDTTALKKDMIESGITSDYARIDEVVGVRLYGLHELEKKVNELR